MYLDLDSYADYIAAYKTYMVDTARVMVRELATAVPDEQLAMVSNYFLQLLHSSVLPFFFIIFFSNHSNSNCRVISQKSCTGCRQDLWLWDECGLEDVAGLRQAQLHCNVQPHDHRRAESAYAQHGLGQVRTLSDSGTVSSLILVMVILWQKMIHIDQIPGRCLCWHWRHCRRRRDCHCCWGDPSIHCSLLYLWFSPIKIMVKYFWMQPGYLQTAQEIEVDMETIGDVSFSP